MSFLVRPYSVRHRGDGLWVPSHPDDNNPVERSVSLTVPTSVEPVLRHATDQPDDTPDLSALLDTYFLDSQTSILSGLRSLQQTQAGSV